jgi:hypothetical protein
MITARYNSNNNNNLKNKRNDFSFRRFTLDEGKNWTTDESGDEQQPLFHDKDRFIELAQAALEEAKMEEEQKGVLQELMEALIIRTGAPMMADVIFEQFRSQDVIEKLAEDHYIEQEKRRRSSDITNSPNILKEPTNHHHHHQNTYSDSIDTMLLISEYIWRLFRLLILSSLVGLVYHYLCCIDDSTNNSIFI